MTDQNLNYGNPNARAAQQPVASGLAQQAPGAYPPPYADEAPSPRPADPPAQPADRFTALAHLDTQYLNRAQKDLRNFIPSDPTFLAHVGALLRALIQHELTNPDRIEADKAAAEAAAQQQRDKAAHDLDAKHEAEQSVPNLTDAEKAALDQRHAAEIDRLGRQHAQADLAIKQAQERAEFDRIQAEQRAALVAPITDVNAPLAGHQ